MKTVSTLCATSTVGVAACGYALARPHQHTSDHPSPLPARFETSPPLNIRHSIADDPASEERPPHSPSTSSRPSTARRWLRRMSGSFSSSPSSSHSLISSSTASSVSRPRPSSAILSGSRPASRNKLVKRPTDSRRHSAASKLEVAGGSKRPSTAANQSSGNRFSGRWSLSRPSTSEAFAALSRRPHDETPRTWWPFFPGKRQKTTRLSTTTKTLRPSAVRRIFPDNLRGRRRGPTLVLAPSVTGGCCENDGSSICSDTGSVYMLEGEPGAEAQSNDAATAEGLQPTVAPALASPRSSIRRSLSLSNFLRSSSRSSQSPSEQSADSVNRGGGRPGIMGFGRRYSTPDELATLPYPYGRYARAPTPTIDEEREQLPTIQSLSVLELQPTPQTGSELSLVPGYRLEHDSPAPQPAAIASESPNVFRPNRLSLMSASERASTLVGSESEQDYGSETVFDSMRTRISELTPVRVGDIFDLEEMPSKQVLYGNNAAEPTPAASSRTTNFVPSQGAAAEADDGDGEAEGDDDDDGWSSDWDVPAKPAEPEDPKLFGSSGLRPCAAFRSGSHLGLSPHSNTSSTSFGTAREGLSDGASMRESNSILDWNDGVSSIHTPTNSTYSRPKTVHGKESVLVQTRPGRRAPSHHVRSQSVPVVNTTRGRLPLASENWDDDFLDDSSEAGKSRSEMIIPRAIEERQASVIGHLGYVREFALLVEDLKRLRLLALSKDIRHGPYRHLWDEVDGIIALASLEDEHEDAPLRKDSLHRQHTWSPILTSTQTMSENKRYSTGCVLLPDDDIFGGNRPATPVTSDAPSFPLVHAPRSAENNDPVGVAKNIMEKLQRRQRAENGSIDRNPSTVGGGKVHFDTDMLQELISHVLVLKERLVGALDSNAPTQPPDKVLPSVAKIVEGSVGNTKRLGMSSVKPSVDDGFRHGMDMVGMEFGPVVSIASS